MPKTLEILSKVLCVAIFASASVQAELIAEKDAELPSENYWAYQAPIRPPLPALEHDFIRNPIDAFILEGLMAENLKPNPRAPARHLIRRAYYDLTGLPPTFEAVEAFNAENDQRSAWYNLVNQLLASERYGEKLASLWLDTVRYAETNGFERDNKKPYIWRYRDYVIKAFNDNKPYDRFVAEQLAGDELPDSDVAAKVATGFMTLMQRDDEPADRDQAHSDMISDIVDVSSEAFLGTTMGCAKCHDHKVDPIPQADYYSLMSFFDSIGLSHLQQPNRAWYDEADARAREESANAVAEAWATIDASQLDEFVKKSKSPQAMVKFGHEKGEARETYWQLLPEVPSDPEWTFPSYAPAEYELSRSPFSTPDAGVTVLSREARQDEDYTPVLHVEGPVAMRHEFRLTELPEQLIFYAQGRLLSEIEIFFNGVSTYSGAAEFRGPYVIIPFSREQIRHLTTGKNVISIVVTPKDPKHGYWFDPGFYYNAVASLAVDDLVTLNPDLIGDVYGDSFQDRIVPLVATKKERFAKPGNRYFSVDEHLNAKPGRIHMRGSVHGEGAEVPMLLPTVFTEGAKIEGPSLEAQKAQFKKTKTTGRRLILAQWLANEKNPLTARVMVNRLWQHCFGLGLVASANDFGLLGEAVSNQALLDWLSVEFMESGWDIKHMLRLMMTSSTYQMSVQAQAEALSIDSQNRLHWRHNPRRLTAEEIWDTLLLVQGKLNYDLGGEPVRPKMPEAVLAGSSRPDIAWPETIGEAANRRAVYIEVKRSIQLPLLAAYDAPQRDATCPTRFATTVPTQALTMLNSERVNTAAKEFAADLADEYTDLNSQIVAAFERALGRAPSVKEKVALLELSDDLDKVHAVPRSNLLERICLILLNLNETIYLD
jgi:hypothetical protein